MKKKWFEKTWILVLVIDLPSVIIQLLDYFVEFSFSEFFIGTFATLIIAQNIGKIYTKHTEQVMPQQQRFKIAGIIFLAYFILLIAITIPLLEYEPLNILLPAVILILIQLIIEALFTYWVLGFGGKIYLKTRPQEDTTEQTNQEQ